MAQILIIERDQYTASTIIDAFNRQQWHVTHYRDTGSGLREAEKNLYKLIIIGELNPGLDASTVCRKLRSKMIHTPVLIISPHYCVDEVVSILEAGGDAYLARPLSARELVARTQALLLRSPRPVPSLIKVDDLEIDKDRRVVIKNGLTVNLRRREFEILLLLAENQDRVLSRSHINARTNTSYYDSGDNCIDVHISNLRKALENYGFANLIETVHGIGYRLNIRR